MRSPLIKVIALYLGANVLYYFLFTYANLPFFKSQWHYYTREPIPIKTNQSGDYSLDVNEIIEILDSIDVAYGAQEPDKSTKNVQTTVWLLSTILLPATIIVKMEIFTNYIGPPTTEEANFTISVKARYNHLARQGLRQGMKRQGYFYVEDAGLEKTNGESFSNFRNSTLKQ
jgi:hypothetical protein